MKSQRASLSEEQVQEWLTSNPVTLAYFSRLQEEALVRRELLAAGSCVRETAYETGENYIRTLTQAQVYEACSSPTLEDILGEDE